MKTGPQSRRLCAAFLLGLVLGAAAVAPFAGAEVERLRLALGQRQAELFQRDTEIGHLQAELAALRRRQRELPTVRSAQVRVEGVDPVTALLLAESAQRLILPLLGRPLDRVDADLVDALLDRRLLPAGDRLYRLRVKYAVLAPEAHVTLVATPVEPAGP